MEDIYYDLRHPAAFGGVNRLKAAAKVPIAKAKKFLRSQPMYRRYKVPKRKFKRAQIQVQSLGIQFQADLFDLSKYSSSNSAFKWILLVVDSFSRLVKCEPLKRKTGEETARGLDIIFKQLSAEGNLAPRATLATDLGNEFFNHQCDDVYKRHNIHHFSLRAPLKCSLAEVSGRYVLEKLYKFMKHNTTKRWIDALPLAVIGKNKRKNPKTANLPPIEINIQNQHKVFKSLYPNGIYNAGAFLYKVGDRVQIVKAYQVFTKSYHGYYSEKTYRISALHAMDVPRYTLIDEDDDETISGTWYADELTLVS